MRAGLAAIALLIRVCVAGGQSMPRVDVIDGVIYVSGLRPAEESHTEADARRPILVFTDDAYVKHLDQAVAGTYSWSAGRLLFKPTYPFSTGGKYHVVFSPGALPDVYHDNPEMTFIIPEEEVPATWVTAVYPLSDVLPENVLRMHVFFSAPMMPGSAYSHIVITNERGDLLDKALLIIDQELWDASRTRLTILFDPGRIKRGLKANLELGPPLKDGEKYLLRIDSTWRDVHGRHLQQNVVKTFRVVAPQRKKLSIEELKVSAPPANSRTPLVIQFDRPMDCALMTKYIAVQDASSNVISGRFQVADDRVLTFLPDSSWSAGKYDVLISPLLEDVSGNNFKNAFDVDLAGGSRTNIDDQLVLSFIVSEIAH